MEIRRFAEEDIAALVDGLWLPFAREMADLDPYNALAENPRGDALAYRRERLSDDAAATFVADDGGLVGYTAVSYADSPPVFARGPAASVEEVYVTPERRGEGVATALLSRVEGWARERGCERITLSVNVDNEAARGLYEDRGYGVRRLKMDRPLE